MSKPSESLFVSANSVPVLIDSEQQEHLPVPKLVFNIKDTMDPERVHQEEFKRLYDQPDDGEHLPLPKMSFEESPLDQALSGQSSRTVVSNRDEETLPLPKYAF